MLPSVTTHSSFTKFVVMSQKWELFFVEPQVKSQWTALVGYLTISTKRWLLLSALSTTILFAFQQHNSCMYQHMVHTTVQQLLRKAINFIFPELWPRQPELNSID